MENQEINILGLLGRTDWTEEEAAQLWQWLQHPPVGLQDHFQEDYLQNLTHTQPANPQQAREILARIAQQAGFVAEETPIIPFPETRGKSRPLFRFMAAAAVLVMAMVGGYFLFVRPSADDHQLIQSPQEGHTHDVNPGTYKAKLRLADGREIILDSAALGELAKQGNTSVINQEGQLVYSGNGGEVLYNTLTTAKSETFKMTLADGSVVYLNSASSIRYPVSFTGNERKVEITGEAYFEVAHDAGKPFRVLIDGRAEVEVLGTEFNVMSYSNEAAIKTTLVNGSVKMLSGQQSVVIKPGQLAKAENNSLQVEQANVMLETAWRNGYFRFNGSDLQTIMRQLSRWYDVEVIYSDNLPNTIYDGQVSRNVKLSEVLKVMEFMGARFKIENKTITVLP